MLLGKFLFSATEPYSGIRADLCVDVGTVRTHCEMWALIFSFVTLFRALVHIAAWLGIEAGPDRPYAYSYARSGSTTGIRLVPYIVAGGCLVFSNHSDMAFATEGPEQGIKSDKYYINVVAEVRR